tara:strand:+ start:243 stop:854 length:612 start_codon:yes stop_codon:yes gene_type:complete
MKENFEKALKLILDHEGGFINHPSDPGGATNKGITLTTYMDFIRDAVDSDALVTVNDLQEITDDDVETIYKTRYWDKVQGDKLQNGLDIFMFDFAVNAGSIAAVKTLQRQLYINDNFGQVDGYLGPKTLAHVNNSLRRDFSAWGCCTPQQTIIKKRTLDLLEQLHGQRIDYYKDLKNFKIFGRGWLNRCDSTLESSRAACSVT